MKARLKITSSFNQKTVYALANESLKFINNRDGILIVENESGKRFAATPDEVTEDETMITLDDAPGTASTNIITSKGVGARTKKATPIEQQTLFLI